METVTLGRTGLSVCRNGFGALPIQRISTAEAVYLLQKAFYHGMNFFDTARMYSDSEEKIGAAFPYLRDKLTLATKTTAQDSATFWTELETSLRNLRTDHVDIYQFHNPAFCPKPEDGSGLYEAMLKAKAQGKIRFIGITNHRLSVAREAIASGLYDTLQFPFSYLSGEPDLELVALCKAHNLGFIAMKGLAGGLIMNSALAYAYLAQFDHVAPIWGVQLERELDEFLSYQDAPPAMTPEREALIVQERQELAGDFCRSCGYCMPCPQGIVISNCARMGLLLRRAVKEDYLTEEWQKKMKQIEECIHCGQCSAKCPYGLDTPALLQKNYEDYKTFLV